MTDSVCPASSSASARARCKPHTTRWPPRNPGMLPRPRASRLSLTCADYIAGVLLVLHSVRFVRRRLRTADTGGLVPPASRPTPAGLPPDAGGLVPPPPPPVRAEPPVVLVFASILKNAGFSPTAAEAAGTLRRCTRAASCWRSPPAAHRRARRRTVALLVRLGSSSAVTALVDLVRLQRRRRDRRCKDFVRHHRWPPSASSAAPSSRRSWLRSPGSSSSSPDRRPLCCCCWPAQAARGAPARRPPSPYARRRCSDADSALWPPPGPSVEAPLFPLACVLRRPLGCSDTRPMATPPGERYPNPRDVPVASSVFPVSAPPWRSRRPSSLVVIAWRRLPCATASSVERRTHRALCLRRSRVFDFACESCVVRDFALL